MRIPWGSARKVAAESLASVDDDLALKLLMTSVDLPLEWGAILLLPVLCDSLHLLASHIDAPVAIADDDDEEDTRD